MCISHTKFVGDDPPSLPMIFHKSPIQNSIKFNTFSTRFSTFREFSTRNLDANPKSSDADACPTRKRSKSRSRPRSGSDCLNLVFFEVFAKKSIFQNCLSGSLFGLVLLDNFERSIFWPKISLQKLHSKTSKMSKFQSRTKNVEPTVL